MNVLMSAYACRPERGSEPGVGWNVVRQIAWAHDVWVLTRAANRPAIESALDREPLPRARFVYLDFPRWARFWKRGRRGLRVYYYLWQLMAYRAARRLHRSVAFDVAHHVTLVSYWMPSFLALLPVPFVWGPVGGGESAPAGFLRSFSVRGQVYELARHAVRLLFERDPFVRLTARRADVALATTEETARRLRSIGCRDPVVLPAIAVATEDVRPARSRTGDSGRPFRLISVGDLLHWKGFDLGLKAFARVAVRRPSIEYWLVGDGPERARLQHLARSLGIEDRVIFWGETSRRLVLDRMAQCDVLVHPSMHDSGACVVLEAMAAGCPAVCLDLGGPALHVNASTGTKVAAICVEQVVRDLADAIGRMTDDPVAVARLGEAARTRVATEFSWEARGKRLMHVYADACGRQRTQGSAVVKCGPAVGPS